MLLFLSDYTIQLDPHVVYSLSFAINLSFARPVKPQLFTVVVFDYIAYSANNTGKRCGFMIYIHKGK